MPFKPENALALLDRANQQGRLGHAYLITGPREADLNTFALDLLRVVTAKPRYNIEDFQKEGAYVLSPEGKSRRIVVGDQTGAAPNTMRHFIQHMQMSNGGRLKPALIQDAERMNDSAQNAFLRTLEEPPSGALFLLLTHNPRALLPTTRSRVIEIALLPPPGARIFTDYEEQLLTVLRQLSTRVLRARRLSYQGRGRDVRFLAHPFPALGAAVFHLCLSDLIWRFLASE